MKRRRYGLSVRRGRKRVYTLLYRRWKDLRNRLQGRSTNRPDLYEGLELGWQTFSEFRTWALANGFNKRHSSPDREKSTVGYVPGNVTFTTPENNTRRALHGDDWRGDEPPAPEHGPECSCEFCADYWQHGEASAA